ncbi:MAG: Gfo/Idh/MocA family oxidoreductase [Clostridia bacterium]|nr:Gfo/Idh/MocA family oxidoreductase [Clostridia bacterium]
MRYGIIGTGQIAEAFIAGARSHCGADVAAVYSRTAERGGAFAARNGIPQVFTDLTAFAQADFEIAYIASPNRLHAAQSEQMLLHGKHVLCEKPITVTPEELQRLQALSDRQGRIYAEAIMYMFQPVRALLREAVAGLGRITGAQFDFCQLSSKYPAYLRGENPNIFNPRLATGGLMDLGVYCVYPALDLFGLPQSVTACAHFLESGADGSGMAGLDYGDKLVTLTYSKVGQGYAGSEIRGEDGTLSVESISKLTGLTMHRGGKAQTLFGEREKADLMGFEAEGFEAFIRNPADPYYHVTRERALQVSTVMADIRRLAGIVFPE